LAEEQTKHETKLKSLEDEESKKIAVEVNNVRTRKAALDHCVQLGFTLVNTPEVHEIKPRASGMRGVKVDVDALKVGEIRSTVKPKNDRKIGLSTVPQNTELEHITSNQYANGSDEVEDFIKLDVGECHNYEVQN